jgi:hypothetical protein
MKTNRSLYAQDCTKLAQQVESLKTKLSKAKVDETILENGLTSNSKVITELLELELYDNASTHPETKLSIKDREGESSTEMEIHKSNVRKILKM